MRQVSDNKNIGGGGRGWVQGTMIDRREGGGDCRIILFSNNRGGGLLYSLTIGLLFVWGGGNYFSRGGGNNCNPRPPYYGVQNLWGGGGQS